MSPRYVTVGGYLDTDPYYVSPEEEAAIYDGPPDWDEAEEPVNEYGPALLGCDHETPERASSMADWRTG